MKGYFLWRIKIKNEISIHVQDQVLARVQTQVQALFLVHIVAAEAVVGDQQLLTIVVAAAEEDQ